MKLFLVFCSVLTVIPGCNKKSDTPSENSRGDVIVSNKHIVLIKDFLYNKAHLNVSKGDTIVWINEDITPHTSTANDNSWDSDLIENKESWYIVVEKDESGKYFCRYHPQMKGVFTVD